MLPRARFALLPLLFATLSLLPFRSVNGAASHAEPPVQHSTKRVAAPDGDSLDLQLLLLRRGASTLQVIDLSQSASALPGTPPMPRLKRSVAEGLQTAGALAGVNGGYFQRDNTPLGLVIHKGRQEHGFQTSKILTGVLVVTPRRAVLLRNAEFRSGFRKGAFKGAPVREALQAGPFLVDKGARVPGLNATRAAERTVILADKTGVVALLVTPSITLAGLGELLAKPGLFAEFKVERALNLDGGSSTAMWVSAEMSQGTRPFSRSEWKRVRNAVAVMPLATSKPPKGKGRE